MTPADLATLARVLDRACPPGCDTLAWREAQAVLDAARRPRPSLDELPRLSAPVDLDTH